MTYKIKCVFLSSGHEASMKPRFIPVIIIIIIVNLYWGCQHHRKSGLQKGPLKVTTNQYNYVKM